MRRNLRRVLCILVLAAALTVPALADTGPKPSVVVDFTGIPEGTVYYATLLAKENSGPWSEGDIFWMEKDAALWKCFSEYRDTDGFLFLGDFGECTETNQFIWAYYPPEVFKILIYFPGTDTFVVTEQIFEQYAFDSYFEVEFHADGALTAERTYAAGWQFMAFLARLALTVGVELLIARLLGFRRRQLLLILGVNILTQLLLNLVLMRGYEPVIFWYFATYWVLEFFIALLEGTVYLFLLPKLGELQEKSLPMFYALVANLASFLLGYVLSVPFPNLF